MASTWWARLIWRRLRTRPMGLVCMRLDEMARVHPDQVMSFCGLCRAPVGIYPSGRRVLRAHPDTVIYCNHCWGGETAHLLIPAPGAMQEPQQSIRKQQRS